VVSDVTPPFSAVRSQTAPILSKPGCEVALAPTLYPASIGSVDESDVVEGTDVTMGTSSEDGQVSPEFHPGALPRRRRYIGFTSSEDELAGGVISECSSISAPVTDSVSLARP
jgi:hypothetical protein